MVHFNINGWNILCHSGNGSSKPLNCSNFPAKIVAHESPLCWSLFLAHRRQRFKVNEVRNVLHISSKLTLWSNWFHNKSMIENKEFADHFYHTHSSCWTLKKMYRPWNSIRQSILPLINRIPSKKSFNENPFFPFLWKKNVILFNTYVSVKSFCLVNQTK